MSRSDQTPSDDRLDRRASLLREPSRALPDSLRSRLLAIGSAEVAAASTMDDAEVDRLYAVALRAANGETEPEQADLEATGLQAAVVEMLAAVFRDARIVRQLPRRLANGLRTLGGGRETLPRWIAEPRWAAAACWMLAFALTLGTGDAGALLLEAPSALQSKSQQWTGAAAEVFEGVRDEAVGTLESGYDLLRSRAVATAAWIEARAEARIERAGRDLDRTWTTITQGLQGPQPMIETSDTDAP